MEPGFHKPGNDQVEQPLGGIQGAELQWSRAFISPETFDACGRNALERRGASMEPGFHKPGNQCLLHSKR